MNSDPSDWSNLNWWQRVMVVTFGVVVVPALFLGGVMLVGMVIENGAMRSEMLAQCQERAVTPQEYARCR